MRDPIALGYGTCDMYSISSSNCGDKADEKVSFYIIYIISITNPLCNIFLNAVNLNWYFPHHYYHHNYCEETSTIISLGQFICENVCIAKSEPCLKSGQVFIVQADSILIRSAKPYLATPGATVHGHYAEIHYEGDTFVTFIYEKLRSGDITQGLPKVEQVLEVRSIDSISMNLEMRIEGWNELKSRLSLVNQIQKHIEIIVGQITSKVLVSKDGMSNVFLPGELIGLLRAERMGRALDEAICYRAILLGITIASLNTQSFISEASFQETARFLAKAALRGRINWLKGLKENVVLGGMIPTGTGFKGLNFFWGEMRDIFFHHRELFDSCISNNLHDTSGHSFIGIEFNDS
ncbi:hypothetical protein ES288_D12G110400v1 [Gossypium darwinii]|uniref:DNA-directed RNA polymerase n=1 Tax=Gossypium darwinii TaxID=34276 RepID=A0A5D2A9P3_GOSDA|nr:hypothetical protein ES288_D12G110400v1 [Gossypium darwinii]